MRYLLQPSYKPAQTPATSMKKPCRSSGPMQRCGKTSIRARSRQGSEIISYTPDTSGGTETLKNTGRGTFEGLIKGRNLGISLRVEECKAAAGCGAPVRPSGGGVIRSRQGQLAQSHSATALPGRDLSARNIVREGEVGVTAAGQLLVSVLNQHSPRNLSEPKSLSD